MKRKVITEKQGMWDHLSVVLCKIDNPRHPWVTWIYNHTDVTFIIKLVIPWQ